MNINEMLSNSKGGKKERQWFSLDQGRSAMNAVTWKSLQSQLTGAVQKVCCSILGTEHHAVLCAQSCVLCGTIYWLLQCQFLQVTSVSMGTAGLVRKFDQGFSQNKHWQTWDITNSMLHKTIQCRHSLGFSFWLILLQTSSFSVPHLPRLQKKSPDAQDL